MNGIKQFGRLNNLRCGTAATGGESCFVQELALLVAIAAPLVKAEFHLSPFRLGLLFSAFFYTYIAFIFLSGWLVDRFNVNLILAGGFLVWSLATAATGLARGFAALFAFRLLLSIGESVAFPSVSKTCLAMFLKCIAVSPMVWFPAG